jgi:Collagen triple helix repeat (20 copies)
MHLRKPSPGVAIAVVALFFALGGSAIAAKHYLITSTKQIKPSVLKSLKGKAGAKGLTGPAGLPGATGAIGKEGAPGKEGKEGKVGPPGPVNLSKLEKVEGAFGEPVFVFFFDIAISVAECPPGSHAISGGGEVARNDKVTSVINEAVEEEGKLTGWEVLAFYSELVGGVKATAYCAKEGGAVQASRLSPAQKRSRNETLMKQAIERHNH